MKRRNRVIFLLLVLTISLLSSSYAARVFIFLHSKGTGTNPQEVFNRAVEAHRCPSPYTYSSQSRICEADPVCPEGSTLQNGVCVTQTEYLCLANNQTYTSESTCTSSCQEVAQCTLGQDTGVYAWGWNVYGQLGDGTKTDRYTPVQVKGPGGSGYLTGIVAVSAGEYHSLALKSDGTVWAWGHNYYGQLGDGTTTQRLTPVQVKGQGGSGDLTGIVAVAAGSSHSLGLRSDGTVRAWGYNGYGQLGDGTTTHRYTPVQVVGPGGYLTGIVAIAAGSYHSLALKSDGTVWAWGSNYYGQLGDGTTNGKSAPVQVKGPGGYLTGIVAIAAGYGHSLALRSDGTVWTWGNNDYGQLGDGTSYNRSTPGKVLGPNGSGYLTDVVAVAAGYTHSLALKSDGTVLAWGANEYGQLGDGTTTHRYTPVQVKGPGGSGNLTDVVAIAAAMWRSFALKSNGTVWAWGGNGSGGVGDGTTTHRYTPVQVKGFNGYGDLTNITGISGGSHSLAVGKIHTCPFNPSLQCTGSPPSCTGQGTCTPSCPPGYTLLSGSCVKSPSCPGPGTYNASTTKCEVRR